MANFAYRARDQKGLLITGHMEGVGIHTIKNFLSDQGLIPLSVWQIAGKVDWLPSFRFSKKVSTQEVILMTRQFYTLFKAGMSMETLLGTLSRQARNKVLKETLQRVQTDISQGSSLSKAFARHPDVFDDLYINMLAAGEEAGILEQILKNLSDLLQKELDIKTGVKSATLYPKLVIGVLIVAITAMLLLVVPEFAKFYAHYKSQLPLPTRILLGMSYVIKYYGWAVALSFIGFYFAYRRYYATSAGKYNIDKFKWSIPVFGELGKKVANARFAHILSQLYHSGFSITKGLQLVENIIENDVMIKDIRRIRADIEKGQSISDAMKSTFSFSPILIEATAIGEKTGALDDMLKGIGEHYDMEIHHTIKNLTTLLEPILLFGIFGMVALFALSIFLPIWNISSAVIK